MKELKIRYGISGCLVLLLSFQPLPAQGYGGPLAFQGLDRITLHSAAGRAMGGISVGVRHDVTMMFQNPAALYSLERIQASLGAVTSSTDQDQEQHYAPVRYYSNLSLLLEGLTGRIPEPDTTLPGFSARDTVQRPYDNIGPDWSRSGSRRLPLQATLAVPFSLGEVKIIAGIGAVQYADLDHYYQHNNVLSPGILSQRPLPTLRPTDDNPVVVDWYQTVRSRAGSLNGYGFALAGGIDTYNVSLGISGLILDGSSDDFEQQVARGKLTFFSNAFRADSVYGMITSTGTSDFKGMELTFSGILTGRYVSIGFSAKPPATITRSYRAEVVTDTTGTPSVSAIEGEDNLKLGWRGTIGLALTPTEDLMVGLTYEFRPYESVRYTDPAGAETSPWLPASLFRIGAVYRVAPWLALRGGMRGEAEVFEPEGNQLPGEPVTSTVYSAGMGLFFSGLRFDLAYEYAPVKYQDTWASAISKNSASRHTVIAQIAYDLGFSGE